MYDPDVSIGGHQPLGFDQWMLVYDHYTVIGSKCTVQAVPIIPSTLEPGFFGIILDDNSSGATYTTSQQIIESKQGGNHRIYGALGTTGKNNPKITKTFSAKKFFGKNAGIVNSSLYRGSASSNPSEEASFGIWAGTVAGNDPGNYTFLVTLEYIAVFSEPKFLAQS